MITVSAARTPEEVEVAARAVWPTLFLSQRCFPWGPLGSEAELIRSWQRHLDSADDQILLVHDGDHLIGARGVDVDDESADTRNGPVALARPEAVFPAFFDEMKRRWPQLPHCVSVSHRNRSLSAWLQERATLVERCYLARLPLPLPRKLEKPLVPVHRVTAAQHDRLRTAMASVAAPLYGNAERVIRDWDRWIVLGTEGLEDWLTAMRMPDTVEVFAAEVHDVTAMAALTRGLLRETAPLGLRELVWFAKTHTEVDAIEPEGFRVIDECERYVL